MHENDIQSESLSDVLPQLVDETEVDLHVRASDALHTVEAVNREIERRNSGDERPFPFPGERVLAQWVADEVESQLRLRASTDDILHVVKQVLDTHERRHGERPVEEDEDPRVARERAAARADAIYAKANREGRPSLNDGEQAVVNALESHVAALDAEIERQNATVGGSAIPRTVGVRIGGE
jgi:plasmid stability protein